MNIIFENLIEKEEIEAKLQKNLEIAIKIAMEYEEFGDDFEVCLSFVDKDEIQRMNREFRNIDRVTDVLSFPQYDEEGGFVGIEDEDIFIGDVILCVDKAREQALEYGHSFEREMIYLTIHSILHLLGYDHEEEEDKMQMRSREKAIIQILSERGIL